MQTPRSEMIYRDTFDDESEGKKLNFDAKINRIFAAITRPIYSHKPKLNYNELEDHFFRLKEENSSLKKQSRDQEDKLRQYNFPKIQSQISNLNLFVGWRPS